MKLIFATNNSNKAIEIQAKVPDGLDIKTLKDEGITEDIPETGTTLQQNAMIKTAYLVERGYELCFADDTGLEIESLDGEPGVYSARYAGIEKDSEANMDLVLEKLKNIKNRKACFRTVISLYWKGKYHQFEGRVDGEILPERAGDEGFGYDPIFRPEGYDLSFAQMSMEQKNRISHRALAVEKMIDFIHANMV